MKTGCVRSMTGFGRSRAAPDGRILIVEASSVNHKGLLVRSHLPEALAPLEREIRRIVARRVKRGTVSVTVHCPAPEGPKAAGRVDPRAAAHYARQLRDMARQLRLKPLSSIAPLLPLPGVVQPPPSPQAQALWRRIRPALETALERLDATRAAEGRATAAALSRELKGLETDLLRIERLGPRALAAAGERLRRRLSEMAGGGINPQDLAREAASAAERADISEEIDRIASHVGQFRGFLERGGPVGRNLEFLAQELAREANTLAAKSQDKRIGRSALSVKVRVDRLREQTANLE